MAIEELADRLAAVRARIERAAGRARRDPALIRLLAVTKIFPAEAIQAAYALGLREFGENYVQEFEGKAPLVRELAGARFHLIGHLQSNKAARAAELFQVVETVDSAKLARRLNDAARSLDVMLEVKLSQEESKHGVDPAGVSALIADNRQRADLAIPTASQAADIVTMGHWIIRKDRVEAALAELGLTVNDVDFLAAGDPEGEVTPVIAFGATALEDPPWARQAVKLLAAAGLGAVLLGLVTFEWCQASVATGIEASLLEAREGAQGNRGGSSQAARLIAMKAAAGILEIWDELSRILPDHTFLTETRVADGKVTLSGFSADAAHLVRLIDKSPLFSGAALTAAITPDAAEKKDRHENG